MGGVHGMTGGACMVGGICGKGGMCGRGVCMAGGHAWLGDMHGRGCDTHAPPGRHYGYGIRSISGRYASYWNAFLFSFAFAFVHNKFTS